MSNGIRTIYSRGRRMAPGQYETPLADFLDRLPGLVNQYQQNQLAQQRQDLADKRYEDQIRYRDRQERRAIERQRIEDLKYIEGQKQLDANRKTAEYNRLVKERRDEYEGVIGNLEDPRQKAIVANRYGYDEDAKMFNELNDSEDERLGKLTSLTTTLKSLPSTATYYDYDKAYKESGIDPEDIEFYRKKDLFGYSDLVKQREKFENQRATGFRSMPRDVSKQLQDLESQRKSIGDSIVKAYADIGYDIRGSEVTPEIIKNLQKEGLNVTGAVSSLMRDYSKAQNKIDQIYNQYRITAPPTGTDPSGGTGGGDVPELKGDETMTDLKSIASYLNVIPRMPTMEEGQSTFEFDSRGDALTNADRIDAQYTLASEPEESDEYKKAMELLSQEYGDALGVLDQGSDIDITTSRPLPGLSGLRERLSIAGQEIQEGEREDSGFRLNPDARAFSLPPEGEDNPEYYDRVARQFAIEAGKLNTLTLNPEQYEGAGRKGVTQKTIELNNALKTRDNLVEQVKELYKRIPKTKKFADQIKTFKDIIDNNPTGLQVVLDRKARGGKGAFKFNKSKLSKEYRQLLADVNKQLDFDDDKQPTQNLMERLLNLQGAIASPNTDPQSNVQPIDLF